MDEFNAWFQSLLYKPKTFCLIETWLTNIHAPPIPGYSLFNLPRIGRCGGGILSKLCA